MRILYLDLDALNPAHLSCYGYPRRTSPAIDALASEGVRFTNMYASDAPCLPSRTAFYSGRFGIQTGVVGHGGTAAEPKREGPGRGFRDRFVDAGLASQLQRLGMRTAMISPFGERHAAHWFYAGFSEIHNTGKTGMESAEEVMPTVNAWLDRRAAEDDWFLHVNLWDAHTPYRVPASYGDPFADEPLPDWMIPAWRRWKDKAGPHSALEPGMYGDARPDRFPREVDRIDSEAKLAHWINGYDTAIRYVDDAIATIVERLKSAGVYEDTAIIVTADHGENQGQLGIYGEHGTADDATCRIPFVIKWPGGRGGIVDDRLHYHLDTAPTLLTLLGGEIPEIWDGHSFAPTIRDGTPAGWPDLVISQCCHVCQRSVRWDRWLYVRTYHDGFHLFPEEMLFDLENDPNEQVDVAGDHPEQCREAAWRLERWHGRQMRKVAENASDERDPLWTVMREGGPFHAPHAPPQQRPLPAYIQRLEQTGRAEAAEALRERYAAYLP